MAQDYGDGTVYQRKSDGRWVAVLQLPNKADGKRNRKCFYAETEKEAKKRLKKAQLELMNGMLPSDDRMTVSQFIQQWLEHKKTQVKPSTWVSYEMVCRQHICPLIGKIALGKLTAMHIQQLIDGCTRKGHGDEPPSTRLRQYVHVIIRQALDRAVKWKLLSRNPALDAEPPRVSKAEIEVLTREQVCHLLDLLKDRRLYPLYLTAVTTGARQGELLALKWEDVDLATETLRVRHTMPQRRRNKEVVLNTPKTDKSRRTIPLSSEVVAVLKMHRSRQRQERLMCGQGYQDNGLVFSADDGSPLRSEFVTRTLQKALPEGFPRIDFHALRHTYTSLLLAGGEVSVKEISESLGHTATRITLDVYAHVLPDARRKTARAMDKLLSKDDTKQARRKTK